MADRREGERVERDREVVVNDRAGGGGPATGVIVGVVLAVLLVLALLAFLFLGDTGTQVEDPVPNEVEVEVDDQNGGGTDTTGQTDTGGDTGTDTGGDTGTDTGGDTGGDTTTEG